MPSHSNYSILIGLFFLAFVQEDSAVVSSALLGYNGIFPYWLTFAACFLGMWVSDIGIYLLMKLGGRHVWNRLGRSDYCHCIKPTELPVGLIDTADIP